MKRLIILLGLCSFLYGCLPAVFVATAAVEDDVYQMKKANCMTRYGFTPEFEYGWIEGMDPVNQTSTQRPVMTKAYIARTKNQEMSAGDIILKVNGEDLYEGTAALDVMNEINGKQFSQMTLKNKSGEIYTVKFNAK